MAAPDGNKNRRTHAVYSYLATGALPPGASYLQKVVSQFRRAIELVIVERKGELSLYDAAVIQTAIRHETVAQLWQRWLKIEVKTMTVAERLSVTRAIAQSSAERDKALKELKLDLDPNQNPWGALDTPGTLEPSEPPQET